MPFKSKAQQRFMFAAEDRGEIPKGTAKRWAAHTPSLKKLPQHAKKKDGPAMLRKMAFDLGKLYALETLYAQLNPPMEKTSNVPQGLVDTFMKYLPTVGPTLAGAYLAGPGYRGEGALAGFAAGHLGKAVGRHVGVGRNPDLARMRSSLNPDQIMSGLRQRSTGFEHFGPEVLKHMEHPELIGGLVGGASGGYAAGRLLGAQNPYGLQPVFGGAGKENPMGIRAPDDSLFS